MNILGHDLTAKMCQCDIWHRLQFSPQATTAGHKTLKMDSFGQRGEI